MRRAIRGNGSIRPAVAVLVILLGGCAIDGEFEEYELDEIEQQIRYGNTTMAYPEVAMIETGDTLCSATILTYYHLITAAHCLTDGSREAGTKTFTVTYDGRVVTARGEWRSHEGWDGILINDTTLDSEDDIALIQLRAPLDGATRGRFQYDAPCSREYDRDGNVISVEECLSWVVRSEHTIVGWGNNFGYPSDSGSGVKREGTMAYGSSIDGLLILARDGKHLPLAGDHGGPAYVKKRNRALRNIQVGVFSQVDGDHPRYALIAGKWGFIDRAAAQMGRVITCGRSEAEDVDYKFNCR